MNKPIAIFFHCLFQLKNEILESALEIVHEQMTALRNSGLEAAAQEIHIGVNGGQESQCYARGLLPEKANVVYHGLQSRAENLTLVMLEKWLKTNDQEWNVLYFHAKGATHALNSSYGKFAGNWRKAMMLQLIDNWQRCVNDLDEYEAAGCNWMTGMADGTQNIFGGNFWWARASYLRILPSIFERERIKTSGIAALESRYEAEVWIGNGPRLPRVAVYSPGGL